MTDTKSSINKPKNFDIDADTTGIEIPSVTLLLRRKAMEVTKRTLTSLKIREAPPPVPTEIEISSSTPPPVPPSKPPSTPPPVPMETSFSDDKTQVTKSSAFSTLQVRPSQRKPGASIPQLVIWSDRLLNSGQDPLGKAIVILLEKGVTSALFLATSSSPTNNPGVPHFISTAAVNPEGKDLLWTGLKWDPALIPELWNQFLREGQIEFPPPGTVTYQKSNRNIMRAAFGVSSNEWLLLVQVGRPEACRGILALISPKSSVEAVNKALPLLQS